MGLFANITHLLDTDRDSVAEALDGVLDGFNMTLVARDTVPESGPHSLLEAASSRSHLIYLVVPSPGRWTALIETDFIPTGVPSTADLAQALSKQISTTALALVVHDDDILFYNLFDTGNELDGYNSNPQYFETERLSEEFIESQRHTPQPFSALLASGTSLAQLTELLNLGWWGAHDRGSLDEDGVPVDDEDFVFESDRIVELGNLLQLHGTEGDYPYAVWYGSTEIRWSSVIALTYSGRW